MLFKSQEIAFKIAVHSKIMVNKFIIPVLQLFPHGSRECHWTGGGWPC